MKKLILLLGIIFMFNSCEESKENKFKDKALKLVKSNLKNPRTSKLIESSIFDIEKDTIKVSLQMDVKNGFGLFVEKEYYVFFIKKGDSYEERFSEYDFLLMTADEMLERSLKERAN